MAGNAVATTAADWQVYSLTRNSLAVGLLTLASSAGMLIGLLAGGMLADRHDRRTVLMAVRLPQAVLAALLMVNSLLSHPALWPLYVITFGIGLLSGLSAPASTAATPALVGEDRMSAAAALNATASQLGSLGGPALAGLLIAGPGLAGCYAIDAVVLRGVRAGHDRAAPDAAHRQGRSGPASGRSRGPPPTSGIIASSAACC